VRAEAGDLDASDGKPIREHPKVGNLLSLEFLDEWDQAFDSRNGREYRHYRGENIWNKHNKAQRRCGKLGSVRQEVLNDAVAAKLLEVIFVLFVTSPRMKTERPRERGPPRPREGR
jgi:hypothetical protein